MNYTLCIVFSYPFARDSDQKRAQSYNIFLNLQKNLNS